MARKLKIMENEKHPLDLENLDVYYKTTNVTFKINMYMEWDKKF